MANFQKFQATAEALVSGVHNLATDTLKIALSNTAPNPATGAVLTDIVQIATAGGYAAGGLVVENSGVTRTAGVTTLQGDDVVFLATGEMGPARYAVLYNDTAPDKPLLGFWDRSTSVTLFENDTLTATFAAAILSVQ